MNNNLRNILAVGIAAALSTACAAGPHQLAVDLDFTGAAAAPQAAGGDGVAGLGG
jgi:hypothetical protein